MTKLIQEDLVWCLRRLPKCVFNLMKEEKDSVMLAGGFIRACIANEKIIDIDLFVRQKENAKLYLRRLVKNSGYFIKTDNAYTVLCKKQTIQFIHKWVYDRPEDIIPSFDFTVARAVIWYDGTNWSSLCDDRYYQDLAAKRLVYCSPTRIEEAGGSMLRVLKFYQRGYRIPLDSLGAVIARLNSAIDPVSCAALDENQMAYVLTGLLREVDPAIDPTHISHLPSIEENQNELKAEN